MLAPFSRGGGIHFKGRFGFGLGKQTKEKSLGPRIFLTLEKLCLELIYLLKELSEFGKNDILVKVKCNVIQGI